MLRLFIALSPLAYLLALTSCSSAPKESPRTLGYKIAESVERGDIEEAEQLFKKIEGSERHRRGSYPILFDAGAKAYGKGEYLVAATYFRFIAEHYDERSAANALLYSLFLARAAESTPSRTLQKELEVALEKARRGSDPPNYWVHLIEAQNSIDGNRPGDAAQALQSFRSHWDGQPSDLETYVRDLEKLIASQ